MGPDLREGSAALVTLQARQQLYSFQSLHRENCEGKLNFVATLFNKTAVLLKLLTV